MPAAPNQTAPQTPSPTRDAEDKARRGTRVLPEPSKSPTVAGMPRGGRAMSDPGDPGIPRPEDDVYANDPADLSEKQSKE